MNIEIDDLIKQYGNHIERMKDEIQDREYMIKLDNSILGVLFLIKEYEQKEIEKGDVLYKK